MLSDTVDIYTQSSEEDTDGLHVSLRSLHGRYLVRLLDRQACEGFGIGAGGTLVRLALRPDAELPDVVDTVRRWIVVPRCRVTVQTANGDAVGVGAPSVSDALVDELEGIGIAASRDEEDKRATLVRETQHDGVFLAYALQWSQFFEEWQLVQIPENSERAIRLGTCIEGIRVEEGTPGYDGVGIAALANATGPSAPKTNVARSGIEATGEREALLSGIYSLLGQHVSSEITALSDSRRSSITKASEEGGYLLGPLLGVARDAPDPLSEQLRNEALQRVPFALVDGNEGRRLMTPEALSSHDVWTIDAPAFSSIEGTLRSAQKELSLPEVVEILGVTLDIPPGLILAHPRPRDRASELIFKNREIVELVVKRSIPQVSGKWAAVGEPSRWTDLAPEDTTRDYQLAEYYEPGRRSATHVLAPRRDDVMSGVEDLAAVLMFGQAYLVPGTAIVEYVRVFSERAGLPVGDDRRLAYAFLHLLLTDLVGIESVRLPDATQLISRRMDMLSRGDRDARLAAEDLLSLRDLTDAIAGTTWRTFSTLRWDRDRSV